MPPGDAPPHAEAVQERDRAQQHADATELLVIDQQLAEARERQTALEQHVDAMDALSEELYSAVGTQADRVTPKSAPSVRDLVERSNALLRADQRHAERMQTSLETLEQLQNDRVSALLVRTRDTVLPPEKARERYEKLRADLEIKMQEPAKQIEREEDVITLEALIAEKAIHQEGTAALERRIGCEMTAMHVKMLLAWAAWEREPDSGALPPKVVDQLKPQLAMLRRELMDNNKTIQKHAASSEHKEKYEAQIATNTNVLRSLLTLQVELLRLESAQAPGSGQAEEPAAQAPQAPQKGQSSKQARRRRRR
jgi:hypothetical protein